MADSDTRSISLNPQQLVVVRDVLTRVLTAHPQSENMQAWVFGSRATGHARPFSDLDILISRPGSLTWHERADLRDAFEASDLPFSVDIVESCRLTPDIAQRVIGERLPLGLQVAVAHVPAALT